MTELEDLKREWAGEAAVPDARAALDRHPELGARKSVVLDLAYEEFCLRRQAGESVDLETFCARFPYRSSLRHLLSLHRLLGENPGAIPPEPLALWPEPGETFGDYTIRRELGRGSFGRVFLAEEGSCGGRVVVLKLSLDGNAEAHTLGRLGHRHVIPIFSARQHESGLFVVCMPFLGSATLLDLLDRAYPTERTPPPRAARVILDAARAAAEPGDPQPDDRDPPDPWLEDGTWADGVAYLAVCLADALAAVHARGVQHRDLKPSNVLLDRAGAPLLLDFNLSEDERRDPARVGGTLPYMAPEQLRLFLRPTAATPRPDGRADLFALAVIVYELLTGRPPFGPPPLGLENEALAAMLLERRRAGCTPLRRLNPDVDVRLARLIESCLAFEADRRPAGAAELAAGLRRYFGAPRRLRRWARKHTKAALAAGCGVLLAAGAAGWAGVGWAGSHVEPHPAVEHKINYFDEGCALLAKGLPAEALAQFVRALPADLDAPPRPEDGPTLAYVAYCLQLTGSNKSAVERSLRAEKAGLQSTGLLNNRAYSYIESGKEFYPEARQCLKKVLEKDPHFVPARYNRAMLIYRCRQDGVAKPEELETAAEDIGYVFKQTPRPTRQLCYEAALIHAAASRRADDPRAEEAREYLAAALRLGFDGRRLRRDAELEAKLGEDWTRHEKLKPLFDRPQPGADPDTNRSPAPPLRLSDPLAGSVN